MAEDLPALAGSATATLAQLAAEYQELLREVDLEPLGFSARLNLLLDLAAIPPSRLDGRVLGVLAINPDWREVDVRRWLQQDHLPPRPQLQALVRLLVARLGPGHDPQRWEAFLLYGSPLVASPLEHLLYREDWARRDLAAQIFARLTERYAIPPSSYDADAVFQHCLQLMQQFNIYEWQDLQPGHMEPFRSMLFPTDS